MDLFKLIPRLMRSGFHCSFVFFWDNLINIYTIRYKCLVLPGCSESRWALCAWVGPAEGGLLVAPWGSTGPALLWWGGGQLKILCLVTRHFFLLLMRDKEHYSGPPEGCLLPLAVRLALPLPLSKWQRGGLCYDGACSALTMTINAIFDSLSYSDPAFVISKITSTRVLCRLSVLSSEWWWRRQGGLPDFKWPCPILTPLQHAAWSLHPHKVRPALGAHCAWKIVGAWSTVEKPSTWVWSPVDRPTTWVWHTVDGS